MSGMGPHLFNATTVSPNPNKCSAWGVLRSVLLGATGQLFENVSVVLRQGFLLHIDTFGCSPGRMPEVLLRGVDSLSPVDRNTAYLAENVRGETLELDAGDDLPELLRNVLLLRGTALASGKQEPRCKSAR